MASETQETVVNPKKNLLLPIGLCVVSAAVSFYSVYTDVFDASILTAAKPQESKQKIDQQVSFVKIDPVVINIGGIDGGEFLKFRIDLEVIPGSEPKIEKYESRIYDTLNSYLRALTLKDFQDPSALLQIRKHLYHRLNFVLEEDIVKDILIVEYVITS